MHGVVYFLILHFLRTSSILSEKYCYPELKFRKKINSHLFRKVMGLKTAK